MKKSKVVILIVTLGITVLVPIVLAGTNYDRFYNITDHGVEYGGTRTSENDNGDRTLSFVCKKRCGQIDCSVCHTNGTDRSKEIYTVSKHEKIYFPRFAVTVREGYRLSWGSYGGYLVFKNNQFAYLSKDGRLKMIAPSESLLLKDRTGLPFLLFMSTDPILK
jgi:hypothetical protein